MLKEINSELNVGNCVSTEENRQFIFNNLLVKLKNVHITEGDKNLVFKIVEGCNYNFELLNDLVKYFLDNPDNSRFLI